MKEALISPGLMVDMVDSPIPQPDANELVIKVMVSGSNPKDWKAIEVFGLSSRNTGDDIAGIVHAVGPAATAFRPGDRVAALHAPGAPHGSFAEYAVAPAHTAFRIPPGTSFEEAATIPLATFTAAAGLYLQLGLPPPWSAPAPAPAPASLAPTPLVVYGASSAVGAAATQLARATGGVRPLVCVAGAGCAFVERTLVDAGKGDVVLDYRLGGLGGRIREAVGGEALGYVFEAVNGGAAVERELQGALRPGGRMGVILPEAEKRYEKVRKDVELVRMDVRALFREEGNAFGEELSAWLQRALEEGRWKPHPFEVLRWEDGGVRQALLRLKEGRASATKFVVRVSEVEA